MSSNPTHKARVRATNEDVEVYELNEGTPTAAHRWCDASGCSRTFTSLELEFEDERVLEDQELDKDSWS